MAKNGQNSLEPPKIAVFRVLVYKEPMEINSNTSIETPMKNKDRN